MMAARPDALAAEVGDAVDAGVGAHHELRMHRVQGLPEIDPLVAARTVPVGRDVIAADEFDLTAGDARMRIGLRNLEVVVDVEPMLRPRTRFRDHMQET